MSYSFHIPLFIGQIVFKSHSRLRSVEREARVPVWRVGGMYVIWRRNPANPARQ